jgi:hypothetical protein
MKTNLIIMAISAFVLAITFLSSQALFADPSAYTGYYITSVAMISGVLLVVSVLRLVLMVLRRPSLLAREPSERPDQRREYYRLTFETSSAPLFVQTDDRRAFAETFRCPIGDLSETGLTLRCTGVYATGQTVLGEIIFASGRTAQVNGYVIREESDRTILALHCTIDPSIFMAEQRERIESQKNVGPRPVVSPSVLEEPRTSLPSHHPKGVCRIK